MRTTRVRTALACGVAIASAAACFGAAADAKTLHFRGSVTITVVVRHTKLPIRVTVLADQDTWFKRGHYYSDRLVKVKTYRITSLGRHRLVVPVTKAVKRSARQPKWVGPDGHAKLLVQSTKVKRPHPGWKEYRYSHAEHPTWVLKECSKRTVRHTWRLVHWRILPRGNPLGSP